MGRKKKTKWERRIERIASMPADILEYVLELITGEKKKK